MLIKSNSQVSDDMNTSFPIINMEEGIHRLGGNKAIYIEILEEFYNDKKNIFQEILDKISQKEWKEVKNIVHTLKGISGNLSLTKTYKISVNLDFALKNKEKEHVRVYLLQLKKSLIETFKKIDELITESKLEYKSSPEEIESHLDAKELNKLTLKFKEQLKQQDADALDTFKLLKYYFKTKDEFEKIKLLLNRFDFETALNFFEKLTLISK